eukprot:15323007-Alexandrium_andersonii.AAC.1
MCIRDRCVAGPRDKPVPVGNEAALAPGIAQGLLDVERDRDVGPVWVAQEPGGLQHFLQVP